MIPYRDIIGLASIGLSLERVAAICACSADKVESVVKRAASIGFDHLLSGRLTDAEFCELVDPPACEYCPINCRLIYEGAPVKGWEKTLGPEQASKAWAVYLGKAEELNLPPHPKEFFTEVYSEWYQDHHSGLVMAMNWTPGEEIQVDWAGKTIPIYNKKGESAPAYVFVATSPYSCYTFARASLDMSMQSWLEHHRHMLEFFGGVPIFLKPDNTRTAVIVEHDPSKSGCTPKKRVHPQYQAFADHYGTSVAPARYRSPDDKAAVETHVHLIVNRNLDKLRNAKFISIDQLNQALEGILEEFNGRGTERLGWSRKDRFLRYELDFLAPLPERPFTSVAWVNSRARDDATVVVRGVRYAIPESFAGKKVSVRLSDDRIDIFVGKRRGQMIASHDRLPDAADTFEGFPGERLNTWAEKAGRASLLDQWHPEKNGKLSPSDITCRSTKIMWWRCVKCGYEWKESPLSRISRSWDDCLACANVDLVPGKNDLKTLFPEIAEEWHPDKNGLNPCDVFPSYSARVWWKGAKCGHEWRASVVNRTRSKVGRLCPYCSGKTVLPGFNDVATLLPELAELWHWGNNKSRTPENTLACSSEWVSLWDVESGKVWQESPKSWAVRNGRGDVIEPFRCLVDEARKADLEQKETNAATPSPDASKINVRSARYSRASDVSLKNWCESRARADLLEQWHPEKNGKMQPGLVSSGSSKRCWWRCSRGHEWQETVYARTRLDWGCPYCSDLVALPGHNDLATLRPDLASEWLLSQNLPLTPSHVTLSSFKVVWWRCEKGHEWEMKINNRTKRGHGCPYCSGKRVLAGFNDLATTNPDLAAEWHPTKNGDLRPDAVTAGSDKKAWWLGPCGHEWEAKVASRNEGTACPYCSGHRALPGFNDLATTNPDLAAEWHPTKNGDLRPDAVTAGSGKKAWWLGPCGHEWEASIVFRARGKSCPYCAGKRVLPGFNDLATTNPDLAAEWHPTRNGDLRPDAVTAGSGKKAWWLGPCGHEWEAEVSYRTRGQFCPYCSAQRPIKALGILAVIDPILAAEWHPTRNGDLRPDAVTAGSGKKAWWLGPCGHEWETRIFHRAKGASCPYCAGKRALPGFNDLATARPDLAAEWHPTKNGDLRPDGVTPGSTKRVWWRCVEGHEWETQVYSRSKGRNCPHCARLPRVSASSLKAKYPDLATTHPDIVAEWHLERNGDLHPETVTAKTRKSAWWICAKGHEWKASVKVRVEGNSCPYCSNRKVLVGFNDLATTHPDLAAEWHPTKNGDLRPDAVTVAFGREVWWRCERGHEWEAGIERRAGEAEICPICSEELARIKPNSLATTNPDLAAEWHPERNGGLRPEAIAAGSNQKVWWRCKNGHEWEAAVVSRNLGASCPYCVGKKALAGFNDLATTHPDLAAEWHPTKNGDLRPDAVTAGSGKKVWWLGPCGHEWEAKVASRNEGTACPYCSGHRALPGFNDLATTRPDLAAEWHPTKNGDLRPDAVTSGSERKAWWLGSCGHEWEASVAKRSSGSSCPFCSNRKMLAGFNDLATSHPDLAAEWHPERNGGLRPDAVVAGSGRKVWWLGPCGHEWEASVKARAGGNACPYCSNRKLLAGYNDLATVRPDLVAEWHPHRNGELRPDAVVAGSRRKVWWLGSCGHEWETAVHVRSEGSDCPYCSNQKVLVGFNDLATARPDLAAEWHPERNEELRPDAVVAGSGRKVWWLGSCGHEWEAAVISRTGGSSCPYCVGGSALANKRSVFANE